MRSPSICNPGPAYGGFKSPKVLLICVNGRRRNFGHNFTAVSSWNAMNWWFRIYGVLWNRNIVYVTWNPNKCPRTYYRFDTHFSKVSTLSHSLPSLSDSKIFTKGWKIPSKQISGQFPIFQLIVTHRGRTVTSQRNGQVCKESPMQPLVSYFVDFSGILPWNLPRVGTFSC